MAAVSETFVHILEAKNLLLSSLTHCFSPTPAGVGQGPILSGFDLSTGVGYSCQRAKGGNSKTDWSVDAAENYWPTIV